MQSAAARGSCGEGGDERSKKLPEAAEVRWTATRAAAATNRAAAREYKKKLEKTEDQQAATEGR